MERSKSPTSGSTHTHTRWHTHTLRYCTLMLLSRIMSDPCSTFTCQENGWKFKSSWISSRWVKRELWSVFCLWNVFFFPFLDRFATPVLPSGWLLHRSQLRYVWNQIRTVSFWPLAFVLLEPDEYLRAAWVNVRCRVGHERETLCFRCFQVMWEVNEDWKCTQEIKEENYKTCRSGARVGGTGAAEKSDCLWAWSRSQKYAME